MDGRTNKGSCTKRRWWVCGGEPWLREREKEVASRNESEDRKADLCIRRIVKGISIHKGAVCEVSLASRCISGCD